MRRCNVGPHRPHRWFFADRHRGRRAGHARAALGRPRRWRRRGARRGARSGSRRTLCGPCAVRGHDHRLRVHRRRAGLDDVHGQPLPLRPGVVEHPGRLHQPVDRGAARSGQADQRLQPGGRAPRTGAQGTRYKFVLAEVDYLKPYWDTLPEDRAYLRRLHRRGPRGDHGRHLQRAEHQSHQPRDDHPQPPVRHRLSARRDRRRAGHRLAAGRVRPRPAVSGYGGGCRADVQLMGARAVPPVGSDAARRRPGAHAVPSEFEWIAPSGRGLLT